MDTQQIKLRIGRAICFNMLFTSLHFSGDGPSKKGFVKVHHFHSWYKIVLYINLTKEVALTLLENTSLFFKLLQRNVNSTTVLEATVSSARTVSVPIFLLLLRPSLFRRLRVRLQLFLVTICRDYQKIIDR